MLKIYIVKSNLTSIIHVLVLNFSHMSRNRVAYFYSLNRVEKVGLDVSNCIIMIMFSNITALYGNAVSLFNNCSYKMYQTHTYFVRYD